MESKDVLEWWNQELVKEGFKIQQKGQIRLKLIELFQSPKSKNAILVRL